MDEILKKYKMLCTQTFTSVFKLPFRSSYGNWTEIPASFNVLKSGVIIDLDLNRNLPSSSGFVYNWLTSWTLIP